MTQTPDAKGARPILTVFAHSPDRGQGLARDMRVRWALEEVGQPYAVRGVTFAQLREPAHLARHPFGQIPTFEDGGLVLFESGAIVLHIAERWPGLLPAEPEARARAQAWMFAALNTVEPPILDREIAGREERDKPWWGERAPALDARVRQRLDALSQRLGEGSWLDGAFSVADVTMATVLLRLKSSRMLEATPNLAAYLARCEARPAYQRAFAAQLAQYRAGSLNAG